MAADAEMKQGSWSGQDGVDPLSHHLNKSLLWLRSCGIKVDLRNTLNDRWMWRKCWRRRRGRKRKWKMFVWVLFQASPTVLFSLSGTMLSRIFCTSVGGTCTQTWLCPSLTVRTTGLETHCGCYLNSTTLMRQDGERKTRNVALAMNTTVFQPFLEHLLYVRKNRNIINKNRNK